MPSTFPAAAPVRGESFDCVTELLASCAVASVPVTLPAGSVPLVMDPVIWTPGTGAFVANAWVVAARIAYGAAASGCRGVISGSVPTVMPR